MAKAGEYNEMLLSEAGRPMPGRLVTVRTRAGILKTLYSDADRTTTVANPVVSDAYGNLRFFTDAGPVNLEYNGVTVFDVVRPDAGEVTLTRAGVRHKSGLFIQNGIVPSGIAPVSDWIYLQPVALAEDIPIDQVSAQVSTAVANTTFRMVIYGDTGACWPGNLLFESVPQNSSIVGIKSVATALTLPAGVVWFGAISAGGSPTLIGGAGGWQVSLTLALNYNAGLAYNVAGSLPATFPSQIPAATVNIFPRLLTRMV